MVVLNSVLCLTEPAGRNVCLKIILVGGVRHDMTVKIAIVLQGVDCILRVNGQFHIGELTWLKN